jgi:hypothetical protein
MAIGYQSVIPWGRSLEEYREMFSLHDSDLSRKILGCGDGPASFNKQMKELGHKVVSCDPVYNFTKNQIAARINVTKEEIRRRVAANLDNYHWDKVPNVDALIEYRMKVMNHFLSDYELGEREGRYQPYSLPHLPYGDKEFDMALCSHFLFLFSNLGLNFHVAAILEMFRVAKEVRIFPLVDLNGQKSSILELVLAQLSQRGHRTEIIKVPYRFQRNADHILQII